MAYDKAGPRNFKSWGETQISRLLDRNNISYFYEQPTAVIDNNKTKIWYPDFTLSDYGMIIEYFGVNGQTQYDKQTHHKIKVYQDNGIEGLFLESDCFRGDWPNRILGNIETILQTRLRRFYNR